MVIQHFGQSIERYSTVKVMDVVDVSSNANITTPDPSQAGTPTGKQLTLVDGRVLEVMDMESMKD